MLTPQVKAVAAGIDNLIKCEDFAAEQVRETVKVGGGGVDSSQIKWKVGEMEFEAWMRLLDSMVRKLKVTVYLAGHGHKFCCFKGAVSWCICSKPLQMEEMFPRFI